MSHRYLKILIAGLALGTAWAVRGQFGHEQGAAWAGAIGAMAIVIISGRPDWYKKILTVALASAVGWGAGGMISYGMVVGYGRSDDFPNAVYGLLMLFVIGGLFGLMGGGLTGLALESSTRKKVRWTRLLTEMTAGGIIGYYLLVFQLGILMTPPRSEAWAVCLGAGAAMLWHMARNRLNSSMRVALITALGAGFGFAFGNFLQIVGNELGINFNMWNVMEYSIGFFGGISLAYSVMSSSWPAESEVPETWENVIACLFIFAFVPLVVFNQSFGTDNLAGRFGESGEKNTITFSNIVTAGVFMASAIFALITIRQNELSRKKSLRLFLVLSGTYIIASYIVTGAFTGKLMLNHHLYVVNYILILILILMTWQKPGFLKANPAPVNLKIWFFRLAAILFFLVILTFILINIHGNLPGAQRRF